MKHLTLLSAQGLRTVPRTMAELGPGDTLGMGLAAMLSGVETYYALDVVRYADPERDLSLFEDLLELFGRRAGSPATGWPDYGRLLDENLFPSHILTREVLARSLNADRVALVREALRDPDGRADELAIRYVTPWNEESVPRGSLDLVVSHAVLQHVMDLEGAYRSMSSWLKPGGMMSHQIDFGSMGMANEWNGHWSCPELVWKLIAGRRAYLINRQPCSEHVRLIEKHRLETVSLLKLHRTDGIRRSQLASLWKGLNDDDLTCSGAFVAASRPPSSRVEGAPSAM